MATKTATSLGLKCPSCGEEGVFLALNLNSLDVIQCSSCQEEYSPKEAREKVREQLVQWDGLLSWIATAPVVE